MDYAGCFLWIASSFIIVGNSILYSNSPKTPVLCILFPRCQFYLSLNSCEKIFCHTSIHFCCCALRGFPGLLKDRVKISRNRDRNILITSIVFQSDTANRALFPSRMKTPAYIYWTSIHVLWESRNGTNITANISAEQCDRELFNGSSFVGIVKPKVHYLWDTSGASSCTHCLACMIW